eukprot:scaffold5540_cov390-Prasinococcus_capsulatus_cf.AAC.7
MQISASEAQSCPCRGSLGVVLIDTQERGARARGAAALFSRGAAARIASDIDMLHIEPAHP